MHAGCILQSTSIAFVEVAVLKENLHKNSFFTSEKEAKNIVMFNIAKNKADEFWFEKLGLPILG